MIKEIREIVEVKARDDFTLLCEMENGETYEYDMSFINEEDGEIIEPLRDISLFKRVWLDDIGALEWNPTGKPVVPFARFACIPRLRRGFYNFNSS